MDAQQSDISVGGVLAQRYRLEKLLGKGGMGQVFLAVDQLLDNDYVALKILHKDLSSDERHAQRFFREVAINRRINHPNVIKTFDIGKEPQFLYLTMEYVAGKTLKDLIETGPLSINAVLHYLDQILQGLDAVHNAEVIHRDLKPANILITTNDTVKISDFGVARPGESEITAHDEIIGCAPYIAPEVWLGKSVSVRSDLYALGIIIYEMLTGELPFDGNSPAELMNHHLESHVYPPQRLRPEIPHWLNELVVSLLAKTPEHRPSTAMAVLETVRHGKALAQPDSALQHPIPFETTHLRDSNRIDVPASPPTTQDTNPSAVYKKFDTKPVLTPNVISGSYSFGSKIGIYTSSASIKRPRVAVLLAQNLILNSFMIAATLVLMRCVSWLGYVALPPLFASIDEPFGVLAFLVGTCGAIIVASTVLTVPFALLGCLGAEQGRKVAVWWRCWGGGAVLLAASIVSTFSLHLIRLAIRAPHAFPPSLNSLSHTLEATIHNYTEAFLLLSEGTYFITRFEGSEAVLVNSSTVGMLDRIPYYLALFTVVWMVVLAARRWIYCENAPERNMVALPIYATSMFLILSEYLFQSPLLSWIGLSEFTFTTVVVGHYQFSVSHHHLAAAVLNWGWLFLMIKFIIPLIVQVRGAEVYQPRYIMNSSTDIRTNKAPRARKR